MNEELDKLLSKDNFSVDDVHKAIELIQKIDDIIINEMYCKKLSKKSKISVKIIRKKVDEALDYSNSNQESSEFSVHSVCVEGTGAIANFFFPAIDIIKDYNIQKKSFEPPYTPATCTLHTLPTPDGDEQIIIFNNGDAININDSESLLARGLKINIFPTPLQTRWSPNSVVNFINTKKQGKIIIINPSKVFHTLNSLMHDYIELSEGEGAYTLLTLWIIGTYFHRVFKSYPYIFLNGVKSSGKTKTLEFADMLCFNSYLTAGMSTASLFRLIQFVRPSIMIDESETLDDKDRQASFRELLLSGYKNGIKTMRVEEKMVNGVKTYDVKEFDLYCPKMIANISGLEEVLSSRCINITMKSALDQDVANREVDITDPTWQNIRNDLYTIYHENFDNVMELYINMENDGTFKNREWELWKPILTLAKFFGKYDDIMEYAKQKVEESREQDLTQTNEHMILYSLYLNITAESDYYHISDIREWVKQHFDFDDMPKWLTPKFVGKILTRLGFKNKRRVSRGIEVKIDKKVVEDLAKRMNIEKPIQQEQEEKVEDEQRTLL